MDLTRAEDLSPPGSLLFSDPQSPNQNPDGKRDEASEALFSLKPVSFRYKKQFDPAGTSQFGLVAEDVEKVNPDLVVRDKEGKPYSVRYDQVNAMLLNEFIKEHNKVEEQQATIADLKSEMKTLAATVQEQALELREVKMQMQIKSSGSVIASNH